MITPFKGRKLDGTRPVLVYRNLRSEGVLYSIQQFGKVIGHARETALRDVKFVVRQGGRERARAECIRNVHAFVYGYVISPKLMPPDTLGMPLRYTPFLDVSGFHSLQDDIAIRSKTARLDKAGVLAWGVEYQNGG